jgi:Methyltransferase FkbM domain
VRLNQLAVSDKTGESILYLSDALNVDHRAYPSEGERRRTIPIQSIALDDYFQPGERVNLIKMDIQGYELHALRGVDRVLADNPRILLLLEFWPYGLKQAGVSAGALISYLRTRGFSFFAQENDELVPFRPPALNASEESSYTNLFARRPL